MRIEISRDETDLIVDALHVFEHRLKTLGTRKSVAIAKMASELGNAIAAGKRTV